ncbi:MAG: alpha/beta fold hydrolase [Planctomycetota bacterium]
MELGEAHTIDWARGEAVARIYAPDVPRAAVVILGALAAPQRYLRGLAGRLADAGYGVVTCDYPGTGDSRALGTRRTNLDDWAAVARAVAEHTRARFPQGPLLAIGHSIGGMLYGFGGVQADAGLLVASAHGIPRHYRGKGRLRVEAAYLALPLLAWPRGFLPGWRWTLGAEVPRDAVRHWTRWGRQARFTTWDGDPGRFAQVTGPLTVVSVEGDDYAPPGAVDALARQFTAARVERVHVLPDGERTLGHFGLATGAGTCERTWARWRGWLAGLEARLGAEVGRA